MEVETLGYCRQLCHILFVAAWMATDEIWNDLLVEVTLFVDAVENAFKVAELLERRFAHELQHPVCHMFRGDLKTTADMTLYQFARVFRGRAVCRLVA